MQDDASTARNEYIDKLKSLQLGQRTGDKREVPVLDETGERVGHHVEHKDGRVDAVATTVMVTPAVTINNTEGD